jgi:hypothetical protein
MDAPTLSDMHKRVVEFKNSVAAIRQVKDGATKAAASLKQHINNKSRSMARKRTQELKAKENEEADHVKKKAKAAAVLIKAEADLADPIFRIDWQKLLAETLLKKITEVQEADVAKFKLKVEEPCLLLGHAALAKMQTLPKVQMAIGNFGGTYKRSLKDEKRMQTPVFPKAGKEEIDTVWTDLMAAMPVASQVKTDELPKGIANVVNNTWLWGFDTKYKGVSFTPNCLAMFKIILNGCVATMMFETKALVSAMRIILQVDKLKLTEVQDFLASLERDGIAELVKNGCTPILVEQKADSILYVPVGYVTVEQVMSGVLIYGLRRTVIVSHIDAVANYEELIGLHVNEEKNPTKMKEALDFMKPVGD